MNPGILPTWNHIQIRNWVAEPNPGCNVFIYAAERSRLSPRLHPKSNDIALSCTGPVLMLVRLRTKRCNRTHKYTQQGCTRAFILWCTLGSLSMWKVGYLRQVIKQGLGGPRLMLIMPFSASLTAGHTHLFLPLRNTLLTSLLPWRLYVTFPLTTAMPVP